MVADEQIQFEHRISLSFKIKYEQISLTVVVIYLNLI